MILNEQTVSEYRNLLANPKENGLPFPSFREIFLPSDEAIAKHIVFEKYQKIINRNIPKLIFYILLDEIFPQKNDSSGCLGYCLSFKENLN